MSEVFAADKDFMVTGAKIMVMTSNGRAAGGSRPVPTHESIRRRNHRGFTLLEMMVVISIMLILVSIAVPIYNRSITRARETVLRQDLFTLRSVINQYTDDKQKAPQSLDDLVAAGYLKQIPVDPFTKSNSSWQVVQEDALMSVDQQEPGISDVHSGSDQLSSEGTAYSSW